jgi:hypothetical protein
VIGGENGPESDPLEGGFEVGNASKRVIDWTRTWPWIVKMMSCATRETIPRLSHALPTKLLSRGSWACI